MMSKNKSIDVFDTFHPGIHVVNFSDKEERLREHIKYFVLKLHDIFKYDNLPDTISETTLKRQILLNGYAVITKIPAGQDQLGEAYESGFYSFTNCLGGILDHDNIPTKAIIVDPFLMVDEQLRVGAECGLIRNDSLMLGVIPALNNFGSRIVEAELSLWRNNINTRLTAICSAPTSNIAHSANEMFKKVENGEVVAVVGQSLAEGLNSTPLNHNNVIKENIEYLQYLKATEHNFFGINDNYNTKREALNSAETTLNDDMLVPYIEDMLNTQKADIDKINKLYGLNISVELSSIWKANIAQMEKEIEQIEKEAEDLAVENAVETVETDKSEDEESEDEESEVEEVETK